MISFFRLCAWRRLGDRARIVAVCDPEPERAEGRAKEFGIAETMLAAQDRCT